MGRAKGPKKVPPPIFPPEGFAPKPTVFKGGLQRMIDIWEAHRKVNTGGYGSGIVCDIGTWNGKPRTVTSCSPFTATCIGLMFDPGGGTDPTATYYPKFDNGELAIPHDFYSMHQGNYLKKGSKKSQWFAKNKWPRGANCSNGSIVFFNLGYEIDPKDMRRGDMVGIDWESGGGHATFCWDVHLDANEDVDCFLYLSSNGRAVAGGGYTGYGVSVGTWAPNRFINKDGDKYKPIGTVFADKDDYIKHGQWQALPRVDGDKIDKKTFKVAPTRIIHKGLHSIARLNVVRFWGFPPPDVARGPLDAATWGIAKDKAVYPLPQPYCMGNAKPVEGRIPDIAAKPVPKTEPEPTKKATPVAAQQKKEEAVGHQHFVESALAMLFGAKWIEKDPGVPDNIADAQSKAAIEDFQTKWKLDVDGKAGPKTRAALKQALVDLHAGKPNPHEKTPPKPVLESFYWMKNRVEPGAKVGFAVRGTHLDLVKSYNLTLTDRKSGKTESLTARIVAKNGGHGSETLTLPASFGDGSLITTKVSCEGGSKSSGVILEVAKPKPVVDEWIWDETKWPAALRDTVKQLRAAQKGSGKYTQREITQYGVWDRVGEGDTPVLSTSGRPLGHVSKRDLFLADIAATMRLKGRILNLATSGNTFVGGKAVFDKFDPKKSEWVDVTDKAPWGMGAKGPLIPFRTLAVSASKEKSLYGKKVFIEQLAGFKLPTGETHNGICIVGDAGGMEPNKQFDLFVGPDGGRIALPAQCNVEILG